MNSFFKPFTGRHMLALAKATTTAAYLLLVSPAALAGPGAHGPNGEHLDSPATAAVASALPRVEAKTDTFELVAELSASALTIHLDRFETNEPVLGAKLDVETGTLKAVATFRAETGDYQVTDAAFLKALAAPGEHGLVFTVVAGKDSDLLDGTLAGAAAGTAAAAASGAQARTDAQTIAKGSAGPGHDPDHAHTWGRVAWVGAAIAALALAGGIAWWRKRRRSASTLQTLQPFKGGL